ncbi:protein LONGIFOLIA 1-like [Salvia miltiorrhiza]|uniref:protein LONGIFOLIA 1-like n=1 Tax=Salvia miltiorrhiza TaxID=226208 RepID=UPI0025ABC6C2|nr:protein LONGIFOLIA 1-like [Salvia miltiorrhiza]XP_057769730.1 protein LONGIFOLIA 1-like [Salvia miltiorrhiza]
MSSLRDESRDLRKQMGCMNGFFQIFDRHHFITGRRISSCSSKRLLQGGQHQMEQQYAMEKGVEMQKEKPRISSESSRASFSSSSCSSTFSSLDFNRAIQPETLSLRQISIPAATTTSSRSQHDLRDVVKESMHREVRSLCIKSHSNDERRGTVMKHIDSPRPPKAIIGPAGGAAPPRAPAKDDRLALLPRFSYDGRESREVYKSAMKHKELPRLSLDSKTNSMKAFESRLNFLGSVENEKSSQPLRSSREHGSHQRTSSVVARLMGLDALPGSVSTDDDVRTPTIKAFLPQTAEEQSKQNQMKHSPRASQSSRSQSANSARKPSTLSRFPVEAAPWRQPDSSRSKKAAASTLHQTSVYGEIEKRVTELEFKKSGKDLRALKQILEAMQKTRARMEGERGEAAQLSSHQNSKLPMWKKNREPCSPKQLDSIVIAKPARVMEKVRLSVPTRASTAETPHLRTPKYQRSCSVHSQKANNLTQENRNVKNQGRHLASPELDRASTTTPRMKVVSPRLQQNHPRRAEVAESARVRKYGSQRGNQSRKNRVRAKDEQLSEDQMSEISGETRYSSYQGDAASVVSEQSETEVTSVARSIRTNTRRDKNLVSHVPAVESAATMLEQPSPISVLDDTFYSEDSPSPVKKITTVFQEEESQCPDEAEWCLQHLNHLMDGTRLDHSFKHNQKLENTKYSVKELTQSNKEEAASHNESLNPDYRYVNKILLTSGLLRDPSFVSTTTEKLFASHHLINPDMFHVLEQTEAVNEKKRIQRKMIFDLVDEILVRKIVSSGLYRVEKRGASPQGLLKEVHSEMERLRRVSDRDDVDEEDETSRALAADMMHGAEDWVDCSGEVPSLVLDIERQIFKDLINEVIAGDVVDAAGDWPKRHCRKLFAK